MPPHIPAPVQSLAAIDIFSFTQARITGTKILNLTMIVESMFVAEFSWKIAKEYGILDRINLSIPVLCNREFLRISCCRRKIV